MYLLYVIINIIIKPWLDRDCVWTLNIEIKHWSNFDSDIHNDRISVLSLRFLRFSLFFPMSVLRVCRPLKSRPMTAAGARTASWHWWRAVTQDCLELRLRGFFQFFDLFYNLNCRRSYRTATHWFLLLNCSCHSNLAKQFCTLSSGQSCPESTT